MAHVEQDRQRLLNRVKPLQGQLQAVERAMDPGAACGSVLHLAAAVRGAVAGLLDGIIAEHLREHVARSGLNHAERAAGADEIIAALRRYSR